MLRLLGKISKLTIATTIAFFQLANLSTAAISTTQTPVRKTALAQNLPAKEIIRAMYEGMRQVEGDRGTPILKITNSGVPSVCGNILGSSYCPGNHTIYLTKQDVRTYYKEYGDAALAFIIGHEYGHSMQKHHSFTPENPTITELQADCLAGYYIGSVRNINFDEKDILKIYNVAKFMGDYNFESNQHHGTPRQRAAAVLVGVAGYMVQKNQSTCSVDKLPKMISNVLKKVPNL
jgi:hypothetical protein